MGLQGLTMPNLLSLRDGRWSVNSHFGASKKADKFWHLDSLRQGRLFESVHKEASSTSTGSTWLRCWRGDAAGSVWGAANRVLGLLMLLRQSYR